MRLRSLLVMFAALSIAGSAQAAKKFYDSSANNFHVSLDNVEIATNLQPRSDTGGPHMFDNLRFGGNNLGGEWIIDNFLVTSIAVPEPGTFAMLLIGTGMLSIARRFRRA